MKVLRRLLMGTLAGGIAVGLTLGLGAQSAHAQLVECAQIAQGTTALEIPGSCIARTLEDQIGTGQGDIDTEGSSIFLINRDPARSVRRGRQLFQRKFSQDEGLGPRVSPSSTGDITTMRNLGAGFADSCAACHGRPRGSAGFGGDVATRPDSRDAPHLFGLGLVEQLADEMTTRLRRKEKLAVKLAKKKRKCIWVPLQAKGVSFGEIKACPNGKINRSRIEGVDENLRVKPFFHQGGTASIREFIIGAMRDEMGLQASDPILCSATDPTNPVAATSPAGFVYDPELDTFERPTVCDKNNDADGDGVRNEVDPALVDHLEFYLLNYFKPGQYKVTRSATNGLRVMNRIGCVSCHKQKMTVVNDRRVADVQTDYDPQRGIFNDLFATASTLFDVEDDGGKYPLLVPQKERFVVENFFSDLKRHDLGPAFHERDFDGSMVKEFVTEPLWGVGSTAPYGHDGRSINLDSVIRRHGGEAQSSKQAYVNLGERGQRQVLEYLETLVLFPPDDTASNLNPGSPNLTDDIQNPDTHGSINLGALFQIPSEGRE